MNVATVITFLGTLFSFVMLIVKEYLNRTNAATLAQKAYVLDQAEFMNIVSSVLTRIRLQAAKDSQAAEATETQVDQSIQDREKNP